MLKRLHARAKGRGSRIVKRNSHITVQRQRRQEGDSEWARKSIRWAYASGSPASGRPSGTPASKQFADQVYTDFQVREFLKKKLADASVSRMHIERAASTVNITIQTARPGIVIGKKGEDIEKLRAETAQAARHAGQ